MMEKERVFEFDVQDDYPHRHAVLHMIHQFRRKKDMKVLQWLEVIT